MQRQTIALSLIGTLSLTQLDARAQPSDRTQAGAQSWRAYSNEPERNTLGNSGGNIASDSSRNAWSINRSTENSSQSSSSKSSSSQSDYSQSDSYPAAIANEMPIPGLSAVGRDIANQLGLIPTLNELTALKLADARTGAILSTEPKLEKPQPNGHSYSSIAIRRLQLKQELVEKILIANLQVRDVVARIEKETTDLDRLSGFLEANRDRAIKLNSFANGIGGGALNEIGQAGEMRVNEVPGEIVELLAGGVVTTLSAISLYKQSGGKKYMKPKANMLAKIFKLPTEPESDYPALVWSYLNRSPINNDSSSAGSSNSGSTMPGNASSGTAVNNKATGQAEPRTRLDELLRKWQRYKFIGAPKDPRNRVRINTLTNTHPSGTVNIALLSDRIDMLADVRAAVYQLDRDLLELMLNAQAL